MCDGMVTVSRHHDDVMEGMLFLLLVLLLDTSGCVTPSLGGDPERSVLEASHRIRLEPQRLLWRLRMIPRFGHGC